MTPFQWFALPVLGLLFVAALAGALRGRGGRLGSVAWMVVWGLGALAVARPELTQQAATAVGIDRGVSLVLYCAVLGLFAVVFRLFGQLRRMEGELTTVVRELALLRAEVEQRDE